MEDTWSSADVRRVEARRWHLLKRLTALQGDQHQMDQRDHLLEAVCLLGDEIQAVKGALRKNPGPPGSPSPSSPLPEVSETDQGEGSLPEPAISRLPYYGLAATPPLVRFQCSSKGDARFSVSAEDIAGQFLESNAYLRSMHTDHRTMMAKGVFLATPQEAKIKDFTTEAASKVTTAVGLSTSEISQLNNRFGEFITVLGALQREQLSIKKGVDAIHLQFGHLRDKMDRLSLSQQGELADLRRGMQGLATQLETLRTQAPLPTPTVHSMAAAAHRQNQTAWAPPAGEVMSGHGVLEQPFPPPPPHSPAPSNIHGPSPNCGYRDMVASVGKAISQIAWYSGDSKVGSAESWVAQIRSLKQLKELGGERIPESIWVQAAVSRGQGEAILFLQKNQTSLKTLDELEAALRRRFEGIRTELSYIQDLERAFMAKGESVTQYGERVKALAERADPAKHPDQNMVALQAFMRGLPDGIAVSTAQMNPQSITEAMNKAQAALSMCEALKTKARPAALHEQPLTTAAIRSQSRPSSPQHGEHRRIRYGRRSASPPLRHKKGSPPPHEKRKSWSYNWNRPFRSDRTCQTALWPSSDSMSRNSREQSSTLSLGKFSSRNPSRVSHSAAIGTGITRLTWWHHATLPSPQIQLLQFHSSRAKDRHDRSCNAPSFAVRDMVYLYTPAVKKGKTKKFNKFWAGPYKIVKVHSDQNVTLKMGRRETRVHTSRLKPFISQQSTSDSGQQSEEDDGNSEPDASSRNDPIISPSPVAVQTPRARVNPTYHLRDIRRINYNPSGSNIN
ncbi:unnamed protein product [Nesidiocoris tenuis]|uniref:Retrotransposon gag domain-containing protein n=1 Tax=Nesidiocoris tenuis TaxID=355587 RepID=A0A6H5GUH3_9HEMI|nr:unnamed protein product [Nesidiocoris tenuis]